MRERKGHYIRKNESTRVPRRHIVIDTEADPTRNGKVEIQTWLCGVAAFCELRKNGQWRITRYEYTDPAEMWSDIDAFTVDRQRTVIWAHNLAYDLRISQALEQVNKHGWELIDIRLAQQGTWVKWKKNRANLSAVDSQSVWNCGIERLGSCFGLASLAYPTDHSLASWLTKCTRDVEILTRAVTAYISWLIDDDMGVWQLTGAGQAWGAWRHKHYTHRILVADDFENRQQVREAMWTGRAEAWSYGTDQTATVYDLDFENAYPRIAAEIQVPVRQYRMVKASTLEGLLTLAHTYAILAEVDVETRVPVVPCWHEQHMVWPVGSFKTVLWDPELRLLAETGAKIRLRKVWLYERAPALRSWAHWILTDLHDTTGRIPEWRKLVLKHWSRALIGRFAMRYQAWDNFGSSPTNDVRFYSGYDVDRDEPFKLMQVGRKIMELGDEIESNDAVPEITGYIMSEARARLWNATQTVGAENILYIDTDSMLVSTKGYSRSLEQDKNPALSGLRLKRKFRGYSIAGPRQYIVGSEARISGVPKKARRSGEWEFEGETWRSLKESIRHGEPNQVRITSRTFRVMRVDRRRIRLSNGRTAPFVLHGTPNGHERTDTNEKMREVQTPP